MAEQNEQNDVATSSVEENDVQQPISKNRRSRNYMILALVLGLVAIIWVVTMIKMTMGAA